MTSTTHGSLFTRITVAAAMLVGGLVACSSADEPAPPIGVSASALTGEVPVYLHASGTTMSLDGSAPTATSAAQKDSAGVRFSGGNAWAEVGTWAALPTFAVGTLTGIGAAQLWVGLKNSDDIGTSFDVRAEIYKNATLVASGETLCVQGITRNPSLAKPITISFPAFPAVSFASNADVLSMRVVTRIGTNGAGASCGGHASAVGLRSYFDAVSRPAGFVATFLPPTISCRTTILDYYTLQILETIVEPDVPLQRTAPNGLVLLSEGWRHAMYNQYIPFISALPAANPAIYWAELTHGGLPGPDTSVRMTVVGDQATLAPFGHTARPTMSKLVRFGCSGTTTILPAPAP